MFRKIVLCGIVCLAAAFASAQAVIIEDFEDTRNFADWVLHENNPPNHTLNAVASGNVPDYVTSGTGNLAGRFNVAWELASPVPATYNPYDMDGGPQVYYAARFNINAPSALPENSIPTAGGVLRADLVNDSDYPVHVAFVVHSTASSQLERGPLVPVAAGQSLTYTWDFDQTAPVGFDTGNGEFSGTHQRVKSLVVYTETPPSSDMLQLRVDNIRHGRDNEVPARPTAPQPVSLTQTGTDKARITWQHPAVANVTDYHVFVATDVDFSSGTVNRLTFPATPAKVVAGTENYAEIQDLPVGENIYIAVTALNGMEASLRSPAFAIRLSENGFPLDRIVLDHNEYQPGHVLYTSHSYGHAVVYTAQALGGLNRSYETVSASAVALGQVALPAEEESVVVWSNLMDGESGVAAISPAALARIQLHLTSGGNVIVSGTYVASSLAETLEADLYASLEFANIGLSSVQPSGALSMVPSFATATNVFNDTAAYATNQNDAIAPVDGGVVLASFTSLPRSTGLNAGVGYRNRMVFLSFAFESVASGMGHEQSASVRQALMEGMINYLQTPTEAVDWQLFY